MSISKAKDLLAKAEHEPDRAQRHLDVAAALGEALERELIVVGGTAEDHYTGDVYVQTDLDMCGWVTPEDDELLVDLGFERDGRHWFHEASGVAVEFPESWIDGSEDRIERIIVEGSTVAIIGVDDLDLDRVRQATAVDPPGGTQYEAALAIALTNFDLMDRRYVEARIEKEPDVRVRDLMRDVHRRLYRQLVKAIDQGST